MTDLIIKEQIYDEFLSFLNEIKDGRANSFSKVVKATKEQSEKYKDTNTGKAIQTIQTFGKAFLEEQAKQAQQAGQTKQGGQ